MNLYSLHRDSQICLNTPWRQAVACTCACSSHRHTECPLAGSVKHCLDHRQRRRPEHKTCKLPRRCCSAALYTQCLSYSLDDNPGIRRSRRDTWGLDTPTRSTARRVHSDSRHRHQGPVHHNSHHGSQGNKNKTNDNTTIIRNSLAILAW